MDALKEFVISGPKNRLFSAIRRRSLKDVKKVWSSSISMRKLIDVRDEHGRTALHIAAMERPCIHIITFLLSKHFDANAVDEIGMTPLMYAVLSRKQNPYETSPVETLFKAMSKGASTFLQQRYIDGASALMLVISQNFITTNEYSWHKIRMDQRDTPMEKLTATDNIESTVYGRDAESLISTMIEGGYDPNLQDEEGQTVLHRAMSAGNFKAVLVLLEYPQVSTAIKDKYNRYALSYFPITECTNKHKYEVFSRFLERCSPTVALESLRCELCIGNRISNVYTVMRKWVDDYMESARSTEICELLQSIKDNGSIPGERLMTEVPPRPPAPSGMSLTSAQSSSASLSQTEATFDFSTMNPNRAPPPRPASPPKCSPYNSQSSLATYKTAPHIAETAMAMVTSNLSAPAVPVRPKTPSREPNTALTKTLDETGTISPVITPRGQSSGIPNQAQDMAPQKITSDTSGEVESETDTNKAVGDDTSADVTEGSCSKTNSAENTAGSSKDIPKHDSNDISKEGSTKELHETIGTAVTPPPPYSQRTTPAVPAKPVREKQKPPATPERPAKNTSSTVSISSASVEPKGAVYPPKKDDRSFKGDFSKDADTPGMLNNYRAMMQGLESLSMKVKSPKSP